MMCAGEGHTLRGIWPPRDIPSYIWDTVFLYHDCDRWQALPRAGGIDAQCSWTLNAFAVLQEAQEDIRYAQAQYDAWEARKKRKG